VLIELFSLGVTAEALRANIDCKSAEGRTDRLISHVYRGCLAAARSKYNTLKYVRVL